LFDLDLHVSKKKNQSTTNPATRNTLTSLNRRHFKLSQFEFVLSVA
jgi:hypothetical protein